MEAGRRTEPAGGHDELTLPPRLAEALESEEGATRAFAELSYAHQLWFVLAMGEGDVTSRA